MPFAYEVLFDQLTRIADALERIAYSMENYTPTPAPQQARTSSLLSDRQAAEWLGLSRAWFQRKRVSGDGPPYVKVGSAVRYRLSDLEKWFGERTYAHTTEWTTSKSSSPAVSERHFDKSRHRR
jgi:predicted DNA-binding transcriptional regulator AlpA